MRNLYSELTNIVGKSPDDESVKAFLDSIDDHADVEKSGLSERICFRQSGFFLHVHRGFASRGEIPEIESVFLFCSIPEFWQDELRSFSPFVGTLPSDISPNDSRRSIRRKLLMMPMRSTERLKQLYFSPDFTDAEFEAMAIRWKEKREIEGFERLKAWDRYLDELPFSDVVDYYDITAYTLGFRFLSKGEKLLGVFILPDTFLAEEKSKST